MKLLQASSPEVSVVENGVRNNFGTPKCFGDVKLQSFRKVAEKIQRREAGKEDFLIPLSDIQFVGMNEVKTPHGPFLMTELAFSQLCALLRVPFDYMQRCPLELRNDNMAYWMDQYDEKRVLMRTRSEEGPDAQHAGIIRAFLPRTYEPIDNLRILEWIAKVLEQLDGSLGIHYAKVSETSTHIRLLFDKPVSVGEDQHYFGVHVADSEVGERGFTSSFADLRLVSDSSCIHKVEGKHLVNQRHIHIDFKHLQRAFDEGFQVATESRSTIADLLRGAQQAVVSDAHSFIRRLVRHYRMTNEFAEAVITAYESEPSPTKYGIVQALTRAAKRMAIDAQVDCEQFAGEFIWEAA